VERLTQLSVTALLSVLLLPAVGPIIDHHFAERQPWHSHVGLQVSHTHAADAYHAHLDSSNQGGERPVAVFNHESGVPVVGGTHFALAASSGFLFGPTSSLQLPVAIFAGAHQSYASPPDRPPQSLA
jgi:hypothetical protein